MKYCHGNNESYRYKRLHNRPYLNLCGYYTKLDGTIGYSVAWMIWKNASQIIPGCDIDIEPIVCGKCGFIFQGIIT